MKAFTIFLLVLASFAVQVQQQEQGFLQPAAKKVYRIALKEQENQVRI
jgi:hypothetical protein